MTKVSYNAPGNTWRGIALVSAILGIAFPPLLIFAIVGFVIYLVHKTNN